jgi:uncharacterized protein YjiS (DUF1127 family)
MSNIHAFASVRFAEPASRPAASPRPFGFAALRGLLATWEERKRFRLQLENIMLATPHLIDDIGLTRKQVEAEIAKRFWQE